MPYKIDFNMRIIFPSTKIKYVTQQKSYPIVSLYAEVGGYIGMFLGYSLLQMPDMVIAASRNTVNLLKKFNVFGKKEIK